MLPDKIPLLLETNDMAAYRPILLITILFDIITFGQFIHAIAPLLEAE